MNRFFFFITSLIILCSCNHKRILEEYQLIPDSEWERENILSFTFRIEESENLFNLFINIRNTNDYTKSNLWLFIENNYPNGTIKNDTLECILAEQSGKWRGSGFGGIYESQHLYIAETAFPDTGTYKIHIEQAMRKKKLQGIKCMGLKIEKK